MLKFRFRKKELRRRSNSCPNLDLCGTDITGFGETDLTVQQKHASCFVEDKLAHETDSEDEISCPSKRERLQAQKSVRKFKKKEKEQQENLEKNLLSVEDFWRKLDSLKEWLHDQQGKDEVEKMQSPKLRSHFKKFMRLWNKRKLPLKYYKNCCVDNETESVSSDTIKTQSPTKAEAGASFLPHNSLKELPTYHHFPFLDEPVDSPLPTVPCSVGLQFENEENVASPFTTFGKAFVDFEESTTDLAGQMDLRTKRKKSVSMKLKIKPDALSNVAGNKFATISRAMPASSVFKSSSPQLHAVVSPTCPPLQTKFTFSPKQLSKLTAQTDSLMIKDKKDPKNPSPTYMSVQDAIPFACHSPKYSQLEFDDVFDPESGYSSLSPFNKPTTFNTNKLSHKPSSLNRRRSKSMEDIYAVPSRLLMCNSKRTDFPSLFQEESLLKTPPVPLKSFPPDSYLVNANADKETTSAKCLFTESLNSETAFDSCITQSDIGSFNSISTDLGYQSYKYEDTSGVSRKTLSQRMIGASVTNDCILKPGYKRRSEEHEIVSCGNSESPKKTKSSYADLKFPNGLPSFTYPKFETEIDMSIASSSRSSPSNLKHKCLQLEEKSVPKASILTGSLYPTTRTPKPETHSSKSNKEEKDRLSILQIKVLDASPTFPRRKIKRRSSSLTVNPGKNFAFDKTLKISRMAASCPRRVSFAKNVKPCDENETPSRRRSSSVTKVTVCSKNVAPEVARQSKDKAEFESFWANHSKEKTHSPTKDSCKNKSWSPSKVIKKIISPPKTLLLSDKTDHAVATSPNRFISRPKGVLTSLSPKKLFPSTSKQPGLVFVNNMEDSSCLSEISEESGGTTRPKSILKLRIDNNFSTPYDKIQKVNPNLDVCNLDSKRCQSPPRLGVASLRSIPSPASDKYRNDCKPNPFSFNIASSQSNILEFSNTEPKECEPYSKTTNCLVTNKSENVVDDLKSESFSMLSSFNFGRNHVDTGQALNDISLLSEINNELSQKLKTELSTNLAGKGSQNDDPRFADPGSLPDPDLPLETVVETPGCSDHETGVERPLSKEVLERIQSFRSSPKVEENDGWITERRKSKSKSFRSSKEKSPFEVNVDVLDNVDKYQIETFVHESIDSFGLKSDNLQNTGLREKKINDIDNYGTNSNVMQSFLPEETFENKDVIPLEVEVPKCLEVDKGYETESTSKDSGGSGSLPSTTSDFSDIDSGCPIYDVPRRGFHPVNSFTQKTINQSYQNLNTLNDPINVKEDFPSIRQVNPDYAIDGSTLIANTNQLLLDTCKTDDQQEKENVKTIIKHLKPKPAVKPKPSFRVKAVISSSSVSSSPVSRRNSNLNSKTTFTPSPTAKRRSSIMRRVSRSGPTCYQSLASPKLKTNANFSPNTKTPMMRKRSSVSRSVEIKTKMENYSSSHNFNTHLSPRENKVIKRNSLTTKGKEQNLGVDNEISSFVQRRQFFQQLQASGNDVKRTPSAARSKLPAVQNSESSVGRSRPAPKPKPVFDVKPSV